ncbi:MAG: protein disulfide oxidoreductase, partial [Gammaproteobacteria bacterium]
MSARRRRWPRWLLELSVAALVFLLLQAWMTRDAPRGAAPDIAGVLLDGTPVTLAELRGKPALVHFWATWCPICGLEQGSIDALAKDYPVLTVAIDESPSNDIRAYLREAGVDYPVLHDPGNDIARAYAIRGVPTSFVIDPVGNISFVERGYTTGLGLRLRLW